MAKREKEARKHNLASKLKELKFRLNIDGHDYEVKLKRAEYFMLKGMKVKLLLAFRGREMQRKDDGMALIQRIRQDLSHVGMADSEPKLLGRNINLMLTPLPAAKRTRKYTFEDEPEVEDTVDQDHEEDHEKAGSEH
jgi:translation initiation factor IF-3